MLGIGLRISRVIGKGGQSAPVAIAATGIGETSFTANWQSYSGAGVYLLDVSTSPTFDTFILQDEEINAPTTSYVVIGLNPNTTYYYRLRANVEYDPDAQAFFDRVTTAGGSLSTTEQTAINTLVLQMKADGIWSKMKAIYPMVGASAAACAQNLKSSSFTGTFYGGWTFTSSGATANASNTGMNTGFIPSNELSDFRICVSSYITNYTTGIVLSTSVTSRIYDWRANNLATCWNDFGEGVVSTLNGYSLINKNIDTEFEYRTAKNTIQTKTQSGSVLSTSAIVLAEFASSFRADGTFKFNHISTNLTDTEQSNLYDAVQAFQTTLSREV